VESMKKFILMTMIIALITLVLLTGCSAQGKSDRDILFQVSTIGALMKGVYDGDVAFNDLGKYGDFGIGTLQGLDGELVELDGEFYQVKLDGTVYPVPGDARTPFAVVTYFDDDRTFTLDKAVDLNQLQTYLDSALPTENVFYAIKINGKFSYMKTRSVPAQSKPYPPLTEAVKNQKIAEFNNIEGTMVGFRCPPYVDGVNVPGYHFHFLSGDRKMGGHVLDLKVDKVKIEVDDTANFTMVLPDNADFNRANLGKGEPEGLKQVEQGK